MSDNKKSVVWFKEVGKKDIGLVGGKGANLGELTNAGIPVPPGYIVTSAAYFSFLEQAKLKDKIVEKLGGLDPEDSKRLQEASSEIKEIITGAPMPPEIAEEIKQAYREMEGGLVAVRSSATAEDLPEASFAGQQRTYLNVESENEVVKAVQGCWASLFESRAIYYRVQQGFDHMSVGIAVPVQRMVQSEAAGVIFTTEPMSNDDTKIAIEAAWGLGEVVVSGALSPDFYIVDKDNFEVVDKKIAKQEWRLVQNPNWTGGEADDFNVKEAIPQEQQASQKLTDAEVVDLAKLAKRIEDVYQFPQDIEWAKEGGGMFIVQSRPITTLEKGMKAETPLEGRVILTGLAASPGAASGRVVIVHEPSEIDKVKEGDILIAEMTTPDFVPAMKRAAAIATDRGGRTCHAAIVSRELGIPCVVGTETATTTLISGQEITVDGSDGKVFEGIVVREQAKVAAAVKTGLKTKTKLYVNLAHPDLADRIAQREVDGVGLLRAEFMVADIGEHPRYMLKEGRGGEFTDKLAQGLEAFAKAFSPRPVIYRTTDFKTNEYRNLKGGAEFEGDEENPMLGYRGCSRYADERDVFHLEAAAIKKVSDSYGNLWVMIPFVRTVSEMVRVRELLEEEGLHQSDSFKLWMMAEVPSNAILLDKFVDEAGIDGISIGSNDLTQLVLGVDRDNPKLAAQFDERDDAVLWALERLITTARDQGITASICGQAPSDYPDLTEKLVGWGITSISVNPDVIEKTREIIAEAEKKL
jgi:pyruvate,water dikinase